MLNKKIIATILYLLACITIYAQSKEVFYKCPPEAVEIKIRLNKVNYLPYEPISATIELKNISNIPQQLGPLDFFSLNLRYRLFKDSFLLERYFLWKESYSTGWGISRTTATQPNETKKEQVILNHYIDLKGYNGEYIFEIGHPIQGEIRKGVAGVMDYKTETKPIRIKEVPVKDTAVLKLFEPNFNTLMDGLNFSKKELEGDSVIYAFDKIINTYPNSYLSEPARFYKAFYYLQKYMLSDDIEDIKKADKLFSTFINKYPDTVYKGLITEYLKTCKAILKN